MKRHSTHAKAAQKNNSEAVAATGSSGDAVGRPAWPARLPWIAAPVLLVAAWMAADVLQVIKTPWPLYAIAMGLAAANAIFWCANRCMRLRRQAAMGERAARELRRHEEELACCTDQIVDLIRRAEAEGNFDIRYENPNLLPCWEEKGCTREVCPGYGSYDLRCWQIARKDCLQTEPDSDGRPSCLGCSIYVNARPDMLTAIGESFNNTMYFLERHSNEAAELQKQIMHQEKMAVIGQMAAGVAHEIGNPLASISSLVQYLMRKTDDTSLQESLSLVYSHIDRISRIVRDMVNFARPMDSDEEILDANEMIALAVKMARYDKRSQRVEIETALSDGLPTIRASGDQLMQVFVNIISNAFDAMPDGGSLTITTADVDNEIRVTFADTGIGMNTKEMQHIFEPFFTTKEAGQGTGLGLSVTDAIVRKFGGRISVDSRKDEGSRFHVYLGKGERAGNRAGDYNAEGASPRG
ncbi:MAG: hypothetical protein HQ592_06360 [Planctomycetes bacterium]|nr:hypothetical protein [Planctomycetota bacterium]